MEILEERKIYQRILERIEEKREEDLAKPEQLRTFWSLPKNYLIFQHLGFSPQIAYEVSKFAQGKELKGDKSRPLHKNKLKDLCHLLDMKLLSTYYGIDKN